MADEVRDAAADGTESNTGDGPPPPVPPSVRWAADPFGRFPARYWDGTQWTEQVLDHDGHLASDPEPLQDPAAWFAAQEDAHTTSEPTNEPPPSYPPPYGSDYGRSPRTRRARSGLRASDMFHLALLLLAALVIFGSIKFFINDDDEVKQQARSLVPGDCLDKPPSDLKLGGSTLSIHVSCTQPHFGEIIFVGDYPPDAPEPVIGDDVLTQAGIAWGLQHCLKPFAAYVGIPAEQSGYDVRAYFPTPDGHFFGFDRSLCVVANTDQSPLTHSVKGTAQ